MENMKWSTQIKVGIIIIHACSKFLGKLKNKKKLALLEYTDDKLESLNNNMKTMRFKDKLQPIEYNLSLNKTINSNESGEAAQTIDKLDCKTYNGKDYDSYESLKKGLKSIKNQ